MNDITYTLSVKVANPVGPTFAATETLKVEAYDRIDVEIRMGKSVTVRIPQNDKRELQMLLIQRTPLDPKSDAATNLGKLTYQVGNSGCWIPLDSTASHFAFGAGFVQLAAQVPADITFKNEQDQTVTVTIFIARKASMDPAATDKPDPTVKDKPDPTATGGTPTIPPGGTPTIPPGGTPTIPSAVAPVTQTAGATGTQGGAAAAQGGACP
jgi:hypothetical protein